MDDLENVRDWMENEPLAKPPYTEIAALCDTIARMREAAERAITIIERNLYHQREKVEDAKLILRDALKEPTNAE